MKKIILLTACFVLLAGHGFAMDRFGLEKLNNHLYAIIAQKQEHIGIAFIDVKTGAQLLINGDKQFPAASVAKVPVMAAAYSRFEHEYLDLDKRIPMKKNDKLGGSGVLQWMKAGQEYTLRNLIRMMISISDNTATKMVIEQVGLISINDYLKENGLNNTIIQDKTMLKEPPLNYTSPQDMAKLMLKIKKNDGFTYSSTQEMIKFLTNQYYRWGIPKGLPRGVKVANKTGHLTGVLNDVAIVDTSKGSYILVVFTKNCGSRKEAREMINSISKTVYEHYVN